MPPDNNSQDSANPAAAGPADDVSPQADSRHGPAPGLPRRLAAMVYDGVLLLPLIMASVAVATAVAITASGDPGEDYSATLPPWVVQGLAIFCVVLFYGYFWRNRGQSLGMKSWRIRLYSTAGGPVSWRQVALRCLGACLSMAALGLGYLWCLVDPGDRCWHDHLSGTELELLPKRKKSGSGD